jgi:hypothetical protein
LATSIGACGPGGGHGLDAVEHLPVAAVAGIGRAIDALDRRGHGAVAAEHDFHRVRNLAQRGAVARGLHRQFQQVAARLRAFGQRVERGAAPVSSRPARTAFSRAICASRTAWLSTSSVSIGLRWQGGTC